MPTRNDKMVFKRIKAYKFRLAYQEMKESREKKCYINNKKATTQCLKGTLPCVNSNNFIFTTTIATTHTQAKTSWQMVSNSGPHVLSIRKI